MAVLESDEDERGSETESLSLIPGLPDEVAELCILRVPYPYHSLLRSVSSSWNRAITHPSFSFLLSNNPYLFVFAFHKPTATIQCHALDPSSARWFPLPPLPPSPSPTSFACASLPRRGKLFLIDAITRSVYVYRTVTDQWSRTAPMPTAKSLFAADGVNGKIVTVGDGGTEIYEPESEAWRVGAGLGLGLGRELARYECAAVGGRLYVTEGWRWPFVSGPRGWAYDSESDTWQRMGEGMREGWTGAGVAVGGRLFMIAEYGESPVRVYDSGSDTWQQVGGDRFPREVMQRPFAVRGTDSEEGRMRMYVVSAGLNVAIGTLHLHTNTLQFSWHVIQAPKAFRHFSPCHCHLLYA